MGLWEKKNPVALTRLNGENATVLQKNVEAASAPLEFDNQRNIDDDDPVASREVRVQSRYLQSEGGGALGPEVMKSSVSNTGKPECSGFH